MTQHRGFLAAATLVALAASADAQAQSAGPGTQQAPSGGTAPVNDTPGPARVDAGKPTLSVTGSVGLISQYRLRGVSFTNEKPAVQGGATVTHASGVYAGFWSSNLAGYGTFGGANLEVDAIGGYSHAFGRTVFDGGLVWYFFPGTSRHQYQEIYGSLTHPVGPASVKVAAYYAPKRRTIGDADNLYGYGDVTLPLARTPISLRGHLGYTTGKGSIYAGPRGRYLDYSAGADVAVGKLVLNVSYVDTDLGGVTADSYYTVAGGKPGRRVVDGAVLASVTATF